jgi:hypothetical protein
MKEIPLTKGCVALVDDEDYEELSKYKWYAWGGIVSRTAYAQRNIKRMDGNTTIFMHRSIVIVPHGMVIDHIDGNGLNNQRSNLRICTRSENMRNQQLHRNNTSGFKGVGWDAKRGFWKASIKIEGRQVHLGTFHDKRKAADAYDNAAELHHGIFARKNNRSTFTDERKGEQ